ncbi:hypothetical protein PROFUN_02289 [Planoprotostelium fungivorum]|uniref:Uncharacterized protein n=1 Tax=Planoprotostelium fungivorum TaxID=1890364 RepID=A0A2P6NYI2_9EUKA|nr:hypothetical protein PROFUN_02289 [Planoprotostelium fungivorum]
MHLLTKCALCMIIPSTAGYFIMQWSNGIAAQNTAHLQKLQMRDPQRFRETRDRSRALGDAIVATTQKQIREEEQAKKK